MLFSFLFSGSIPFLLEAAAVLAALVHWHASPAQSHSLSMFMGMSSLAAYLQLQVVWVCEVSLWRESTHEIYRDK
ncbi:TPA: hypothetical protein I7742_20695 [Vibrio vulnificus]|nr:hypothetical protein [Vibrio vulnificus]HAS8493814.1 hypothetical protein [Vibrio vulnificus]